MDSMKALGVAAIILAHSEPPAPITPIVSTFYIVIFFFVSGYFFKDAYSEDLSLLARRRLVSLYVPFLYWNLGYLALHNAFFAVNVYSSQTGYLDTVSRVYTMRDLASVAFAIVTLRGTEQMAGALWFVASLITVTALFGLTRWTMRRLSPRYVEYLMAVAVALLFSAGYTNQQLIAWPMFLNASLVSTVFFYFGTLYRRTESRVPVTWPFAIVAAVVVVLGRGGVHLGDPSPLGPVGMLIVACAGIYLCLCVATWLEPNRVTGFIGRNSLAVVATHFLAFKLVSLVYIKAHGLPAFQLAMFPVITGEEWWWAAYFACGLLVPTVAVYAAGAARDIIRGRLRMTLHQGPAGAEQKARQESADT
jgi:fucose 4-O-acetylase-like acetyltransferase